MGPIEITLVVGLIVLANWVRQQEAETFHKLFDLLLIGINVPIFFVGVLFVFQSSELRSIITLSLDSPTAFGVFLQATAVWGFIVSFRSTRHSLERILPIDPHSPLHTLALVLSGYLAGSAILAVAGGVDGLAENLEPVSIGLFLAQQLVFVLVALLGVGAMTRREWPAVFHRLGLEPVNGKQMLEAVGWIALLVGLQWVGGVAWQAINPEQVELVNGLNERLYEGFGPLHWLALSLGAGIGEEILFRGALQPVLGIGFTSVLFAIIHVQYGFLTPAILVLFLLSLCLGFVRRRHNTTVAIVVHIGYDLVLSILTLLMG